MVKGTLQLYLFKYAEYRSTFKMIRAASAWHCSRCQKRIDKGSLHLWSQTHSNYGDGIRMHFECADKLTLQARKTLPKYSDMKVI